MPELSALLLPKVSDRYEIKESAIGHGGMGVVYKAYDNRTRRFVALKTISGEVDPTALALFEREWNVLARISHPNIVDILDTGEYTENGHRKPFFVMPLLPGATLDRLIKTANQRLTIERTVEIICQVCRGLQAAHEQGLVHRDIKPSNIFVMDDDTVKIIDFGVVHLADARTVTGLKGTPSYMSPEQIEGKPATALSDIFSLGVVAYEALTGRKPFASRNEGELFDAIRSRIPPPVSDINPAVNQALSRSVHKAIAKQPWHRFSSAKEFADTLQKALRNEPIERFDRSKIQPRIERIKKAYAEGDFQFATEILTELESEGHVDPDMSMLRLQLDQAVRTKTIRQLLDSARTRMEEDEYPLALQKIQDVLSLDPDNVDAVALRRQIEKQRGAKQVENWFRLVAQHLDNQDHAQARQGLQEILKVDSTNTRARELLATVDREEQETAKTFEEQQKLYDAAVASYRNGEISTALSKLERLIQMKRAGSKPTDRDAQYLSLYNQVRSEREAARNLYAEGRKCISDKNFNKALQICDEYLGKHPGDPLFQALRLEAEEIQRQDQSAAIAEINRRVDAEADLDKKYNIVKEAVERYPTEAQFKSQLKLLKDRRELVNSIVARAQQYEERGQLNDAAAQWDILRNIYPAQPGLDLEIQRLARRREEQVTEEAKARWVEQIDQHITAGEYVKAREAVKQALVEFPNDQELRGLDSLAELALKRSGEASALLEEGQKLLQVGQFDAGIELLRKAERLDERNPACRAALTGALLQRARDVMSSDWRAAEPLVREVLALEPSDPVARSLTSLIADYKRQDAVTSYLLDARNLQAAGKIEEALAKIEEGLRAFPSESRLLKLQHTLQGAVEERRKKDTPPPSPAPPNASASAREIPPAVPTSPPAATLVMGSTPPAPPVAPPIAAQPTLVQGTPIQGTPATSPTIRKQAAPPQRARLLAGAVIAAILLIAGGIAYSLLRTPSRKPVSQPKRNAAVVKTTEPQPALPPVPEAAPKSAAPELRVSTDVPSARVLFDDDPALNVQDGTATKQDITPGDHRVALRDAGNTKLFDFSFTAKPSGVPTLSAAPSGTVPGIVAVSFTTDAIVYGTPNVKGGVDGQPLKAIPADGEKITLASSSSVRYLFDDGKGKPHAVMIEASPTPELSVVLSGAPEMIPVTITANAPDAMVLINGRPLKTHLKNGNLTLRLPPHQYKMSVKADDYENAPEQLVEVKTGSAPLSVNFTLSRIAHMATLVIEGAPPDSDVLLDGSPFAAYSSGTLKADLPPGQHTITVRKHNYVDLVHYDQFAAGQTYTINAAEMKAYGKLLAKVTPANARLTYKLHGEVDDKPLPNNQEQVLPPGDYTVKAEAENFLPESANITVLPGKDATFTTALKSAVITPETLNPTKIFENGKSWTFSDPNSWWTYGQKGFSFTHRDSGSLAFTLAKDTKPFLKKNFKKYEFVADYRDEENKIQYTLDSHHLTRKVYVDGKERKELHDEVPINAGDAYRLSVQITADTVTVSVNGASESTKRPDNHGKFGFVNEVVLIPR